MTEWNETLQEELKRRRQGDVIEFDRVLITTPEDDLPLPGSTREEPIVTHTPTAVGPGHWVGTGTRSPPRWGVRTATEHRRHTVGGEGEPVCPKWDTRCQSTSSMPCRFAFIRSAASACRNAAP